MIKNINKLLIIFFLLFSPATSLEKNYFNEGKKLFEKKEYDKAKFKFEKDIVLNRKNELSYLFLAKIFNKKNTIDLEENNLNTVLLLNPQNEEAVYYLALLNIKKSNYKKANELIETLVKICKNFCSKKKDLNSKLNNISK
ncbi:hypothetical protein OAS47_04270 [Pelagibacteraceae bacterium]|nr:hypothetical protein [Pelagibacteraceae bacterium]|tara:strand:- start:264 stop:686 length:423 start_codon:yes stop_codon:yes gene_type:complete